MKTSRSQRARGVGTAVRWVVVMMAIMIAVAAAFVQPARASRTGGDPVSASVRRSEGKIALLPELADSVELSQLVYLIHWPTTRLMRLNVWLELGMEFEGPWTSEELDLMVTVLDAFGATYGDARFAQLVNGAVVAGTGGSHDHLRLVKLSGTGWPAAYWSDQAGEIRFLESLFDDIWFAENYHWTFLEGSYTHPQPGTTLRQVVIGHELSHVLIDGLRVEVEAAGHDPMTLETLYGATVEPAHWPHLGYVLNESLASELSVWALGVERTADVDALRAELGPYLAANGSAASSGRP